ncbi:YpiF family protein [Neobacillus mesonae]|uniref:YpiF family protein n=1 Tax=Neobacillus mesonae TaxID=1193713 RepID=UPI000829BA03|nr:YpiF family protein [Neobacillus mesonae]MED4204205.1 YpiF family protein [Neobacillus mesonae]
MKWIPQDVETYSNAKEYVDTAVVPLYSVLVGGGIKQSAAAAEFITLLTNHLERQFTGRILLFPPFTYLEQEQEGKELTDLQSWEENIYAAGFKHVFYITSNLEWRRKEGELKGSLIWIPAIPLEHMNDSQKLPVIDSQVKQLLTLFTQKWHENE